MGNKVENLLRAAASSDGSDASLNGAKREFAAAENARAFFALRASELADLRYWNENSGLSSYSLFDEQGRELGRTKLCEGDLVRILLKGSGKYDWVRVIRIDESPDEMIVTVSPDADPTDRTDGRARTSHFFAGEATNNFCLRLSGTVVEFMVIGLNERTNTDETGGLLETARNVATANLGYFLGIQKSEWTSFAKSFLDD